VSAWTPEQLSAAGSAEELEVASLRPDGTLRNPVTIWVVRSGDDLYVRSVNGPASAWYRGTLAEHAGRIWAGGVEKDVAFEDADHGLDDRLDAEYRRKYGRYPEATLERITGEQARSTTYRIVPRTAEGAAA
jgi:hypothetical protein